MGGVICAGHVNWDVTLRVDRLPERDGEAVIERQTASGGGSAANVAGTLAGLDVSVSLLGSVGDDDEGAAARAELEATGVDCSHVVKVAGVPTTTKYLVVDARGDTMVLGHEGANEAFEAADLPPTAFVATDHLHLTSQPPETAVRLAQRARDAGVAVSFDPGRRVGDRDFEATLSLADVVFLNDREAAALSSAPDSVDGRIVVVKHGQDGAAVHADDGTYTHSGLDVDPVDTAGAGDAFAAGFIAARREGAGYERALAVANVCGALASRTTGARTTLAWDDVQERLG